MKNKILFTATIIFTVLILASCGDSNSEEKTKLVKENSSLKDTINKRNQDMKFLNAEIEKLSKNEKESCPDGAIHYGNMLISSLNIANKNVPYRVLYIYSAPTYETLESEEQLGFYTVALLRSEEKIEKYVFLSEDYENHEGLKNPAPVSIKAGDVVWIEDTNVGEGTTETTLMKR